MALSPPHTQTVKIDGDHVQLTNLDKVLWPRNNITKSNFLHYLNEIAPHFLPFLVNRHLTVVRYPHGVESDYFFQKNAPAYAPTFVQTDEYEGTRYIVCSELSTLIWLGNQAALEFHIPFHPIHHPEKPAEIVFDLDPPDHESFHLAVSAALQMKQIFDKLGVFSFIKTSGNKGLQVYLPLPENRYSYHDTRRFTSFIAHYLIDRSPDQFTVERLKKKRKGRLYIDYVQHGPGKTIIAPYSPRANPLGTVATPLNWEEVHPSLRPEKFTMESVLARLKQKKCPFRSFDQVRDKQPIDTILTWLKGKD